MNVNHSGRRILVIAPTPFFADRGCHVRILEEARALKALGHQVTICTYHNGRNVEGIDTRRIIKIPWYSKLSAGPSVQKLYLDLLLLWTVIRTCVGFKPHIVHAHLHEGVVIGKMASLLFGIPLVADYQGSMTGEMLQHQFIKEGGLVHRVCHWVEGLIAGMADVTLVSSAGALDESLNHTNLSGENTKVIADGVDTWIFRPDGTQDDIRVKLSVPEGVKLVGFLGLLTEYQGVSVLLEAIPHDLQGYKPVHFLIMGFPNEEYYQQKARDLGIGERVIFTGKVPYEEVPRYLGACDVSVSPKLFSTEANGKLLNYMAMGLPVVASDTPVNHEILGDLGIYAEVGNPISLAGALLKVLSDDKYARDLGIRLREKAVAEYSWQSVGELISSTYEQLAPAATMNQSKDSVVQRKRI